MEKLVRSIRLAIGTLVLAGWLPMAWCQTANSDPFAPVQDIAQVLAETNEVRVERLLQGGDFAAAAELAQSFDDQLSEFSTVEDWSNIVARCQLAQGQYDAALRTLDAALVRFPQSIRLRHVGIEISRFNNQPQRSVELLTEIIELVDDDNWRYRDVENQLVLADAYLLRQLDAKQVIDKILGPTKNKNPRHAGCLAAIARLALDKNDYQLAAENFRQAIELQPGNPDLHCGLAQSFLPSDPEKTATAIEAALQLNPQHVDSLLLLVDQKVSSEDYVGAEKLLQQILTVNPHQPIAWAYRAVLANLDNRPAQEAEYREQALKHWSGNPAVDQTIGRELSQKYRFAESVPYQRRALVYDNNYLPAKLQLAHDLLRLGQELEGWLLADEIFDADQYNVVAHNLVKLRENLANFRTLEGNGFVVRMETEESYLYGERVLELLTRAQTVLCARYNVKLEMPIFIEIFPRQQDFAIRTFGLPGGNGFLGVCFGRLITMNSPAAQGSNLTNWESVLWHEFCHVVTLQKTKNRMPRWLSEGISVYEERQSDPAWGQTINPKYRTMMLGAELTPVSQLSGAFLNPASPMHLQFAYYQSSLVVEYLIQEYGRESLNQVLDELALGTPINDALRRHLAPIEFLDQKFGEFAIQRASEYAADANWDEPDLPITATADQWRTWNGEHPRNIAGLLALAQILFVDGQFQSALAPLNEIIDIDPIATPSAYVLLAKVYRQLDDQNNERQTLERLIAVDVNSIEPLERLLELSSAAEQWPVTKTYARRLIALNPLIPLPFRYLSTAAEATHDDPALIESLRALARMNPLDVADLNYRLAGAFFRENDLRSAKRHVLIALEQAPRFQDAHQLLLNIVKHAAEPTAPSTTDANFQEPTKTTKPPNSPAGNESKKIL